MAKKRHRRKLTKAEAGRLGGKATVRKYGQEHMRKLGKAGFARLRRKLGYMGGAGLGAIQWLQRQGKFPRPTPEQHQEAQELFEDLWRQLEPKEDPQP
jgi:hypothetical protein